MSSLFGKDLICTQDWEVEELLYILNTALQMKSDRFNKRWTSLFQNKNFLMLFYSPSVRTHLSFVAAASDLGGHAQYMEPRMGRFKTKDAAGEIIEDLANVMSGYMAGIGIRIMETAVNYYGSGNDLIKEFAYYANVPVINMADDKFHPCQALSDVMGWAEEFSANTMTEFNPAILRGKKLLLTWGRGALARSWNSPQETLLLASRLGMEVTLARPDGYDLDENVYQTIRNNCEHHQQKFEIINNSSEGYDDADVVYSRNWISPDAYHHDQLDKQKEIDKAMSSMYKDWVVTNEKMLKTRNALFSHPMPVDRDNEIENSALDSRKSVIYNIAKNRLHIQKAVIAHTMTDLCYNF